MKKIYYQCRFRQTAPLRLSNGENDRSDSDLMLTRDGKPFIPGSAVAGVLRTMLLEADGNTLFGWIEKGTERAYESPVLISDAILRNDDDLIMKRSVRHGVGINDQGTAEDKRKYDFEIIETNGTFVSVLELTVDEFKEAAEEPDRTPQKILETLMERIAAEGIQFGARTSRGYGRMEVSVYRRIFRMTAGPDGEDGVDGITEWLSFDPFDFDAFRGTRIDGVLPAENMDTVIRLGLRMLGTFSVRVYTAEPDAPDYAPLRSFSRKPVLPGTGWAGAIRHHMRNLADEAGLPDSEAVKWKIDLLFGVRDDSETPVRSRISFSEMTVEGGDFVKLTRVAIDRYTMKPKQRALFTSGFWQGGSGELDIRISGPVDKEVMDLFEAALLDLHFGLLPVGGESSVGRGRAEITGLHINGEPVNSLLGVPVGVSAEEQEESV